MPLESRTNFRLNHHRAACQRRPDQFQSAHGGKARQTLFEKRTCIRETAKAFPCGFPRPKFIFGVKTGRSFDYQFFIVNPPAFGFEYFQQRFSTGRSS
ncbi:MAG: hypothetical protein ACLSE6_02780 [Alphaproteobacteria bacterium]